MDISESGIEDAAAELNISLTEAEVGNFVDETRHTLAQFDELESSESVTNHQVDPRPGSDAHNAFLYEFELSEGPGALDDLDVAVKDLMAIAGVPMTCGSNTVEFTPQYDSTAVRRLLEAGAHLVGTTNMDEFALNTTGETCAHGPTENPVVSDHVPGGSSSGSGAAVAAGFIDAALGSDTGGSIRIPASYCGVVGLKPTHRSVPRFGIADLAPSLDHIGPIATSVETVFRVFDAISGVDVNDPSTHGSRPQRETVASVDDSIDNLTIGVVDEAMAGSEQMVVDAVDERLQALADHGATIERVSLPLWSELPAIVVCTASIEFAALLYNNGVVRGTGTGCTNAWRETMGSIDMSKLGDGVVESLVTFRTLDEATEGRIYVAAQNVRRAFTRTVCEALDRIDVLATPTTQTSAPEFGAVTSTEDFIRTIANTCPFDLTGHPSLSVPCPTAAPKPVGCQITAPWYDESTLAEVGGALESNR
jgi:Asp-tRNA(Asn)/Glu-tRNA(Gln) amidotransferase A subunit family amidase